MGLSPPPFPSKGIEVGEPETLNRYAYANGNPISNVDPFGLSAERSGSTDIFGNVWNGFKDLFVNQFNDIKSTLTSYFSDPFGYLINAWSHPLENSPTGLIINVCISDYNYFSNIINGKWNSVAYSVGQKLGVCAEFLITAGIAKGAAKFSGTTTEVTEPASVGVGETEGPVEITPPPNATPEQIAQTKAYIDGSNQALETGKLSPTGRVSTAGSLRNSANAAAAMERARAAAAGTPYQGHVGHVPDTTWTGTANPFSWLDLDPSVNMSIGGQANRYPIGYKPTEFRFKDR